MTDRLSLKALRHELNVERVGIEITAPSLYVLAVGAVDGTTDLMIKPLTALSVPGITGIARAAEGDLMLPVGLSFLLNGATASIHRKQGEGIKRNPIGQ